MRQSQNSKKSTLAATELNSNKLTLKLKLKLKFESLSEILNCSFQL